MQRTLVDIEEYFQYVFERILISRLFIGFILGFSF